MSRRSIVMLLLLALLGAWGVWHARDRGRATPGPVASALSPGFCPRDGFNPPQRLPVLHDAVSISFEGSHLVAVDRQGNVWSYYRGESSCYDPAPIRVLTAETAKKLYPEAGLPRSVQRRAVLMDGRIITAVGLEFPDRCGTARAQCTLPLMTPVGLDEIVAVARGDGHILVARREGSLWSKGMNDCGQLGRDERTDYFKQVPGMSGIVAVAAGMRNSMALDAKGVVWVWGSLSNPLLSTTVSPPVPGYAYCSQDLTEWAAAHHLSSDGNDAPDPVEGLPRIRQISSYYATDFALDMEGRVWGWGFNTCGQVGVNPGRVSDPDLTDFYIVRPRPIEGLPPVHAIAAGKRHALALDAAGRVWAWGENADTELGQRLDLSKDGSFACSNEYGRGDLAGFTTVPHKVPGIGKAVAIAAGYNSSAAIDEHGDVWVWGRH